MDLVFFGDLHLGCENFLVSVVVMGDKVTGVLVLDFCRALQFIVQVDVKLVGLREAMGDVDVGY